MSVLVRLLLVTIPRKQLLLRFFATAIRPQASSFRHSGKNVPNFQSLPNPVGTLWKLLLDWSVSRSYKAWWSNNTDPPTSLQPSQSRPRQRQRQRMYQIAHDVHGVSKDVLLCNETFVPMALPQEQQKQQEQEFGSYYYSSQVVGPSGDPFDVIYMSSLSFASARRR